MRPGASDFGAVKPSLGEFPALLADEDMGFFIVDRAGTIRFAGADITRRSSKQMRELRRGIQVIFQDPYSSLNPRMTVGEILGEPLRVYGLVKSKKDEQERVAEEHVVRLANALGALRGEWRAAKRTSKRVPPRLNVVAFPYADEHAELQRQVLAASAALSVARSAREACEVAR